MLKTPTISYKGERYAYGQKGDTYAIWNIEESRPQLVEQWPKSQEGRIRASARFAQLENEDPDAFRARSRQSIAAIRRMVLPQSIVLCIGIALGIASLFPSYLGGSSVASQPPDLVNHLFYLGAWSIAVFLFFLGGKPAHAGVLLSVGVSATTFGFFFSDAGTAIASGSHVIGTGLDLGLAGWVVCAGASIAALVALRRVTGRPRLTTPNIALLIAVIAGGAAIAFAPSWDRYTLFAAATGQSQTITAGNAFANPGAVIAGNVAVMIVLAALAVIAALWRPIVLGASLLLGVLVPMIAQAISALVQWGEPTPLADFGITKAEASQAQLQVTAGFTPSFYIYCAFLVALALVCLRMFLTPEPTNASEPSQQSPPGRSYF